MAKTKYKLADSSQPGEHHLIDDHAKDGGPGKV